MFITSSTKSLSIISNTANSVTVRNNTAAPIQILDNVHIRLYDDDNYNAIGTTLDGDENEPISRPSGFNSSGPLRYLSDAAIATSGTYSDGTPINILAKAYVLPEYGWAENVMSFGNSVPPFRTNVDFADVGLYENIYQNSAFSERDEFWIGYFLISYQGREGFDHDGTVAGQPEGSEEGLTGVISACDCLVNSPLCPRPTTACSGVPAGGNISFVYLETLTDQGRDNLLNPNWTVSDNFIAAPHELGHQFGLMGDQPGSTYFIMDYPSDNTSLPSRVQFHPEHINIIRHRVKSPGR